MRGAFPLVLLTAALLPVTASGQATTSGAEGEMTAGTEAMREGNLVQAIAQFKAATAKSPHFAEAFLDLGLAYEQQGNIPEALAALDRARTLKPTLRGANLFLGIAEYQLGDARKAEEALRHETKLNPKDAKALMWLGVAQLANDEPDQAAATLDMAYALDPKDPDILYHRGRAHALVSKESYEQMNALDPDGYRVHEVLGEADIEAERTADAITEYKAAIERAPRRPGLHESLADLEWASGDTAAADTLYQQELAIDPYSFLAWYKLGSLRVIDAKGDSLAPLEKARSLDPNFPDLYYYLGRAQVEAGQEQAGIENLKRASVETGGAPGPHGSSSTLNMLAYYQLSRVYRRLHETAQADDALAQFRKLRAQHDLEEQQKEQRLMERGDKLRQLPKTEPIPQDADPGKQ
jgi:tetratricopeptide (TPR) repeat protein